MTARLEVIEQRLKARKRKRILSFLGLLMLPLLGAAMLTYGLSQSSEASYDAPNVPAISAAQTQPIIAPASSNRKRTQAIVATDSLATPAKEQSPEPATSESLKEGDPAVEPRLTNEVAPLAKGKNLIPMPDYSTLSLKKKMDLMRNMAYGPEDKARLKKDIIGLFVNRGRARVSVIQQNASGQRNTLSYPIGMYLDRLAQNPRVQFRLVEKVNASHGLSGLVVKE